MSLIRTFDAINMNSSFTSSNSDELIDELSWTSDFATPGKYSEKRYSENDSSVLNMSIDETAPCTPPSSKRECHVSLKLFETPCTPSTLLRRSSQSETSISPNTSMTGCSGIKAHYHTRRRSSRLSALKRASDTPSPVSPIANPFQSSTPVPVEESSLLSADSKRRKLGHDDHDDLNDIKVSLFSSLKKPVRPTAMRPSAMRPSAKRQARIQLDLNQSRYKNEFIELRQLGAGQFGEVYKCQNRVDRCFYALKRLTKPLAGSLKETSALREVYAHAVLGKHQHILQYYSAWAEDKHMIIQNEYCNGGSLGDVILQYRDSRQVAEERDLKQILVQVSKGLRYMHSTDLVHMDIKPCNIFISHREVADDESRKGTCYKIGDLGMVTKVSDPKVEEGDVRYLPKELIDDDYRNLPKADVFSLALTVHEMATLEDLPNNGPVWHAIREGLLFKPDNISDKLHKLLLKMISFDPTQRPGPATILTENFLLSEEKGKICELKRKLNEEKMENQRLMRELAKAKDSPLMNLTSSRLVGKQLNRSMSIA